MQRGTIGAVGVIGAAAVLLLGGCSGGRVGRVVAANAVDIGRVEWTDEDLARPIAIAEVRRTEHASHHVVRLAGVEPWHVHDRHELTVFVMTGTVRMHVADQVYELTVGDVVQVPHGLAHRAENIGREPAEAYVVITPPYDGDDARRVE